MILHRSLLVLAFAIFTSVPTQAEELTGTNDAKAAKPSGYELKKRSRFGMSADARAPFWPIGWVKPKNGGGSSNQAAPEAPAQRFLIEPHHFTVTSVLSGNPALATINGRAFGEGEPLPVVAGNERVRVVVRAIRDGGVTLQQDDHSIFVPLRRVGIVARPADAPAITPEFTIKIQ